jgi:hypothetical protein
MKRNDDIAIAEEMQEEFHREKERVEELNDSKNNVIKQSMLDYWDSIEIEEDE